MLARYMDKAYGTRKIPQILANELRIFLFGDLTAAPGISSEKYFSGGCSGPPDEA